MKRKQERRQRVVPVWVAPVDAWFFRWKIYEEDGGGILIEKSPDELNEVCEQLVAIEYGMASMPENR